MKILVTGGTGYIGSHTVVELQQQGYEVIIIDNLVTSHISVLKRIEKITGIKPDFYKINLCNQKALDKFFNTVKDIKGIIHFAAYKSVGESVINPLDYYKNNIQGLINILQNMKNYNIQNLIFSSSCTVYGQPDKLPVTENSPVVKPASPYGNTKKISEEIIEDAVKSFALNTISLRYFNPIGAHSSAFIGEMPVDIPNNLLPYITQTANGILPQLKVFGNDYNTPDGTAIRDYIHITDLALAHIAALKKLLTNKKNNFSDVKYFNIGTGRGASVKEVIDTFEKVTGIKLNYIYTNRRPGDVEQIWADTKLANKELNWKAERSLEDMLLSAWNWEKAKTNLNIK